MLKLYCKTMYLWHYGRHNYHEILLEDCLYEKLRSKLQTKANYHLNKAENYRVSSPWR